MAFLERRRLNFFDLNENADSGRVSEALGEAKVTTTTHGYGFLVIGDSSGNVHLISKNFDIKTFRAYELNISLAEQCKLSPYLVTIGEDESGINPVLKVWHIEKFDKNGIPVCLRISRASIPYKADFHPSCIAITDSLSFMAVGFPDGSILLYRGDVKRERTSKQKLLKYDLSSITGLAFHTSAKTTVLYVATVNSIEMFDVTYKDKEKRTHLDKDGCSIKCSVFVETGQDGHFFVAKNDAVYCYTNGEIGPCYALHGEKIQLEWFRGYLVIIAKDNKSSSRISSVKSLGDSNKYTHELTVLDSQDNSLTVFTSPVQDVFSILVEWGLFYILSTNKSVALVAEKDLQSKLSLLFKKNLYDLAIRIAKSQHYDADGLMEIFRQYGDHLYSKGDHKGAINQYIKTIGKLEPSYVIRKYLGSQQVENLTTYLQALHKEGAATGGHTTLLLNFYTKLNKPELLKEFIMTKDREVDFDVEVAIDVCRHVSAEDALLLAEKHSLHDWYLTIQIEDQKKYQAALDYIAKLDFEKAEVMIKKYGITLLENIPEETTHFLKKICTDYHPSDEPLVNQSMLDGYTKQVQRSSPEDFIHYFLNNSEKLVDFLEHLTQTPMKWSSQVYTTLLEHYLQIWGNQNDPKLEQKIMHLLESQDSLVSKLQALLLCKYANFKKGLLLLYEQNKMYESILKYHIAAGDYSAVVVCCRRFEHQKPGLWTQALWALSSQNPVPSKELSEILQVIERNKLLPPILVIEALSNAPSVKIGNVWPYLKKVIEAELEKKNEQTGNIEKYDAETKEVKKSIDEFKTKPVIFQGSRCGLCKKQLELPSVHFLCQHSFHQHCVQSYADNDDECPPCLERNKQTISAIKAQEENRNLQEVFHSQLEGAEDGFSLAADYLGKVVLRKMSSASGGSTMASIDTNLQPNKSSMNDKYSRQKVEEVQSRSSKDSYHTKRDWKMEDTKTLLASNLRYQDEYMPRNKAPETRVRDERITSAMTSANPFGDDDDSANPFADDPTNPFNEESSNPFESEQDNEADDYDKNLNPFAN